MMDVASETDVAVAMFGGRPGSLLVLFGSAKRFERCRLRSLDSSMKCELESGRNALQGASTASRRSGMGRLDAGAKTDLQ